MSINQENYEQYFLDHLEGTLSPEMEKELLLFLESHPDLKALLETMAPLPLLNEPEPSSRLRKNQLKKKVVATSHINEINIDEWLVMELEGMLDSKAKRELDEFISLNPAYVYDREKYKQAVLHPDLSIRFMRKGNIRKRPVIILLKRSGWVAAAVAAALAIFFGIRFLYEGGDNKGTPSQFAGTPSHVEQDVTPSQYDSYQVPTGTPSQNPGTPSRKTLSQSDFQANVNRTPSRIIRTPSPVNHLKPHATAFLTKEPDSKAKSLEKKSLHESISFSFPEEKEKSLLAKVFANFTRRTKDGLKNQIHVEENNVPDFNFWTIARAGIQGYNNIADRDVELYVHRDADGRVSSYALVEHNQLLVEKNLGKN